MGNLRVSEWRKLPVNLTELCLDTTLRCGQSFRWKKLRDNEWHAESLTGTKKGANFQTYRSCALSGSIFVLKQDSTYLHYRTLKPDSSCLIVSPTSTRAPDLGAPSEDEITQELLKNYFNLKPNLTSLYKLWSSLDPNFKKRAPKFAGVRILKQDAWEALVSFICSSNNNITRISQMVNNLCLHYGVLLGHVNGQAFHDFPTPESLTGPGTEAHLRELGFGYRARYIAKTALIVAKEKPEGWLQTLCNPEVNSDELYQGTLPVGGREGYRKAHKELLELQGVGPKVADCVCLMGLCWGEAVPVDTHVWQIAQRDYKFGKGKHKSLTKATYDAVGDHFRQLWGIEAGWAHSVLFAADLKTFSDRLVAKVEIFGDDIKIKEEDDMNSKPRVMSKREYALDKVKPERKDGKESSMIRSTRLQGVKRRRII